MNPSKHQNPLESPHTPANPNARPESIMGESQIEQLIADANAAEHSNPDTRAFMEPKTATGTGKRGRKRKNPDDPKWTKTESGGANFSTSTTPPPSQDSSAPPPNPDVDYSAAFRGLFVVGSNSLVRATRCEAVALTVGEIDSLAIVWGKVAARYLPSYLNQHAELVQALVVTGAVGYRIKTVMDEEIRRRKEEAQAKKDAFEAESRVL